MRITNQNLYEEHERFLPITAAASNKHLLRTTEHVILYISHGFILSPTTDCINMDAPHLLTRNKGTNLTYQLNCKGMKKVFISSLVWSNIQG